MKYTKSYLWVLIGVLFVSFSLRAALAPYIPSYDDRYEEDLKQASANTDYFKEPSDVLNYAQYRYVGAHAAEKYPRFFTEFILQEQTILGMLSTGARGLMISVYDWSLSWSSIITEGVSVVCSHPTEPSKVFRKNGRPLHQTLHYEMNRIFNFLKSHPKAIITIFIKDHADLGKLVRDIKEITTRNNYDPILKPSDWIAAQEKGEWPSLGWMRSNNKRLVMFTQIYQRHTDFTWPVDSYFWENNYGTIDESIVCDEQKEFGISKSSRNRKLVSFGCYGSVSVSPGARNSLLCLDYDFAKNLTSNCQKRRFAQGRLFNAYWVDHLISATNTLVKEKRKTIFDYVNELNAVPKK